MLIENSEALRVWLTSALEPICDADPAALAKYVMALLKKDKPEQELKEFCIEQLDVFLQSETRDFVDRVFEVVANRSYIPNAAGDSFQKRPAEPLKSQPVAATAQSTKSSPGSTRGNFSSAFGGGGNESANQQGACSSTSSRDHHRGRKGGPGSGSGREDSGIEQSSEATRIGLWVEPETGAAVGTVSSSGSIKRSGSDRKRISPPRDSGGLSAGVVESRVDRDRKERDRERDRNARSDRIRSKSKDRNGTSSSSNRRRQAGNGSERGGVSIGSRSSRHYRDRDSGREGARDGRRPRSRSPRTPPRRRSRSKEGSPKTGDSSSSGGKPRPSPHETPTAAADTDSANNTPSADKGDEKEKAARKKKERCRDYDEKGYCMKGDRCPFDHGPDPVVVNDSALPGMIAVGSGSKPSAPATAVPPPPLPNFSVPPPGYTHPPPAVPVNPPPPGVDSYAPTNAPGVPGSSSGAASTGTEGYNPESPALTGVSTAIPPAPPPNYSYPPPPLHPGSAWNPRPLPPTVHPFGGSYMAPAHMIGAGPRRELITLAQGHDATQMNPMVVGGPPSKRGRGGVMSRLGPRVPFHARDPAQRNNTTLEVRKIPPTLNNISKLNEHFQQFGQITNIQVRYEGDPEAALITFAVRIQAQNAYKSTSPILNNRFIKVFWHNPQKDSEDGGSTAAGGPAVQQSGPRDRALYKIVNVTSPTEGDKSLQPYQPQAQGEGDSRKEGKEMDGTEEANINALTPLVPTARELAAARKNQKRKEKEKKIAYVSVWKKKKDLLMKLMAQQKDLITAVEASKEKAKKKQLMAMLRTVSEKVGKLEAEVKELWSKIDSASSAKSRTKEIVEKEKLDLELELMSQQQAGGDTMSLQRRLTDLKSELQTLVAMGDKQLEPVGTSTPNQNSTPGTPGRGGRRNRMIPQNSRLDKRPRNVIVTGFSAEEKDSVIGHLEKYGEMTDLEFDNKGENGGCRALGVYKTRMDAERAVGLGGDLKEGRSVKIQWGPVAATERRLSMSGSGELSEGSGKAGDDLDSSAEKGALDEADGEAAPNAARRTTSDAGESDGTSGRRMTAEQLLATIDDFSSDSGGEREDAFEEEEEEEEDEKGWKRA